MFTARYELSPKVLFLHTESTPLALAVTAPTFILKVLNSNFDRDCPSVLTDVFVVIFVYPGK